MASCSADHGHIYTTTVWAMVVQAFQPPLSWQSVERMVMLSQHFLKYQLTLREYSQ